MMLSIVLPVSATTGSPELTEFKQQQQSERNLQLKAAIAEQFEVTEGLPKLHKDLQDLSGDEEVAVIVQLSENPVALEKGISQLKGRQFTSSQEQLVKDKVLRQQASVSKEMTIKGISFEKGFSFDTVLNGFAAKVKADDLEKLLAIKGVALVEPDTTVYALEDTKSPEFSSDLEKIEKDHEFEAAMNTSISFLGIEKLWDEGYKGKGIKVAVLDTGIDSDHPEFEGIYKGGKNFIPNSSMYTRERADDDARETSPVERPANQPEFHPSTGRPFYTSHGSHVAGTIAAIGANEYGIKGIAPEVDLYAYRVLGAYGSGSNSGIIKAIDTAVIEKMDVINLSLGDDNNSETDLGSFAINNAMLAGTISVVATGNSGPGRSTIGTPATARLGIAVGNTTNPEVMHDGEVNITVGDYKYSKHLNFMATSFGQDLSTQLEGEFELVAVPGIGKATDYNGIDVEGKVALISRGEIAFVDKIAVAKENGAIATIIHNFAGGTNAPNESEVFLGDSFGFVPTIDMSVRDGAAIREALKNGKGKVIFGKFGSSKTLGDELSDSSSRGPSTPNFDIKPDVIAPGTNIMSSVPAYKWDFPEASYEESYDRSSGTSMATPHIAGIAALVKQANPTWDAFDVKVALSNTAKLLNTEKYDVFAQGPGRVDAYAAAHPSVLAYALDKANNAGEEVDNVKGTVTFGFQELDEAISVTKQIRVKDLKGVGGNFTVEVDVTKSFADAKLTIDESSFTLAPNGEQLVNVTLTASENEGTKLGDEFLGYIHINGGQNHVSLPFAVDFSGEVPVEIKDMRITETDLSFNDDGVKDTAMLYFTLTGDVLDNYIELWDIENPDGGYYGDGYIGYLHAATSLGAGSYQLSIAGQYRPWGETAPTPVQIPDGLYTIDFSAETKAGNEIGDYVGPIVVKSTKPVIEGNVAGSKLTGQVTDKYIDYNDVLKNYGLHYDLNSKLKASYVVTSDGVAGNAVPFELNQNGSFEIELDTLGENDVLTVMVEDAAGNKGEKVFSEDIPVEPGVTLTVNQENITIEEGKTATVTVTETTVDEDGTKEEVDVTSEATYEVENEEVVSVDKGVITGKAVGTSKITITYGENSVTVNVTVKDSGENPLEPGVTLSVDRESISIEKGKTATVTVTEATVDEDGTKEEVDVTSEANYEVENEEIISVDKGVITAKAVGTSKITITHGDNSITVNVTVTNSTVTPVEPGIPSPVTPTTPSISAPSIPSTPKGEVNVNVNLIAGQVKDSAKQEVKVDIPALTDAQPKISAKLQASSLKELAQSSKPLVLKSGDVEMNISNKVLKDIAAGAPDSVIISIGTSKSTGIDGAVSAIYEFTITTAKNGKSTIVSEFSEPIQVTVPTSAVKDERKAAAYHLNGSTNALAYVGGANKNGKSTFKTSHFSKFVIVEKAVTFKDIEKHWAQEQIEVLASRSITSGNTAATFTPEGKLTRAEFAVLLVRALNIPTKSYEGIFSDVTEKQSWSVLEIEAANRVGIVKGDQNGKFNPQDKVTREQMASMIVRAIEYKNANLLNDAASTTKFADESKISGYAKDAVQQAAALGIIKGKEGNTFAPQDDTNRAEAAVMLYRFLNALGEF